MATGEKAPGAFKTIGELSSELGNVRIDRSAHYRRMIPPHRLQQLRARDHLTRTLHEREKQLVLLWRELDRAPVLPDAPHQHHEPVFGLRVSHRHSGWLGAVELLVVEGRTGCDESTQ